MEKHYLPFRGDAPLERGRGATSSGEDEVLKTKGRSITGSAFDFIREIIF
jgi:hypothetical protein